MGFFSSFFGGTEYSTVEHLLTTETLRHLFWSVEHPNLTHALKEQVEVAVLKRRHSDDRISLRQIHETLLGLEHQHLLNEFNRKDFEKIFKNYFDTHFKG